MNLFDVTVVNLKKLKLYEILIILILLVYIFGGKEYSIPLYVNIIFSYASLIALSVVIYLYGNSILAIIFLIASLVFINRNYILSNNLVQDGEYKKKNKMNNLNKHLTNVTLEEEIVGQVEKKPDNTPSTSNYHPVLCDSHNASKI